MVVISSRLVRWVGGRIKSITSMEHHNNSVDLLQTVLRAITLVVEMLSVCNAGLIRKSDH